MNICFIGGGNMAAALIDGLLRQGAAATTLQVVEMRAEARRDLQQRFGVAVFEHLSATAVATDVVVLAVKPQQLPGIATQLRPLLNTQLVVSIAAGVRAADLSRWLGDYPRLVRAMPNTPARVGAGMSGLFALPGLGETARQRAETILAAAGGVLWLDDEAQMDAITAVSGSGPAYVFYFLQAMEEGAKALGLDAAHARRLGLETFRGACQLAAQSGEPFAELRAQVTSRGGTTERALQVMETAGIRHHIGEAMAAAAERSRELGDALRKEGDHHAE